VLHVLGRVANQHLPLPQIAAQHHHLLGWSADALEAQAFAFLAVRALNKLPYTFPTTTGVKQPMTGGVIADPRG